MTLSELYISINHLTIRDKVEATCGICQKPFTTIKRVIYSALKNNQSDVYCKDCVVKAQKKTKNIEENITVFCGTCGKELSRRPGDLKQSKSGKLFCSRSCSATYQNKNYKELHINRRQKEGVCAVCSTSISASNKYCKPCLDLYHIKTLDEQTKGELFSSCSLYSAHSKIRGHAFRQLKNSKREKKCEHCGYSKHVEVCHIKDVKDFDSEATISEINALKNLKYLCPNCHWEFDN